jgi:hypothetical protein
VPTAATGHASDSIIPVKPHVNGGCNFVENPALDSRDVQPQWLPSPSSVVRLIDDDDDHRRLRFSLWRIPGRKTLVHDGRQLQLTCEVGLSRLRLLLGTSLSDGGSFAFVVPSGADARSVWAASARVRVLFSGRPTQHSRVGGRCRPTKLGLLHMRALQALDGALTGASQREIAVALFGAEVVSQKWHADGEFRARIRYLIRRASALMNGDYCSLVHGTS